MQVYRAAPAPRKSWQGCSRRHGICWPGQLWPEHQQVLPVEDRHERFIHPPVGAQHSVEVEAQMLREKRVSHLSFRRTVVVSLVGKVRVGHPIALAVQLIHVPKMREFHLGRIHRPVAAVRDHQLRPRRSQRGNFDIVCLVAFAHVDRHAAFAHAAAKK